ncbi:hypothetical protein FRC06_005701, partial [Ceratobasidium sp. 370]
MAPHTLSGITAGACDRARQELQSVRSRLSHATQDCLVACELMQTAYSSSGCSSAEREQALLAVDAELSAFAAEEANIRRARNVLTDIRNRSRMIAPIYSLPVEILVRIFSRATCYCTLGTDFDHDIVRPILNPILLSAVCRRWRQVAINHRALWTHIDLGVCSEYTGQRYNLPSVWVERSQGAPLYITIRQHYSFDLDYVEYYPEIPRYDEGVPPPMFGRLLRFLAPLMPQVYSLRVSFSRPEQYMLDLLLDRWIMHGTVGHAKVLEVNARPGSAPLNVPPSGRDSTVPEPSERYREFFQSLEALELANTIPSWLELTLRNLVCLDL